MKWMSGVARESDPEERRFLRSHRHAVMIRSRPFHPHPPTPHMTRAGPPDSADDRPNDLLTEIPARWAARAGMGRKIKERRNVFADADEMTVERTY